MNKWYVLQVLSGHENKVKKTLEENLKNSGMDQYIEEILVPTENVQEVKKGQQKVTEKKLWPGYILIKMNLTDDAWSFVKNINSVIDFLGGDKPTPLTEAEVKEILQELEEKKKGVVQKHKFEVGDTVKITEGVFVNFIGSVTEINIDKGKISVLVSIFGRDTRVDDLEFWQVEHVTQEGEK
ncbi:MAG: transcription termination/antitermination protein NusG [Parachlamydiales bacterium]|nr:transcription termination/antitermination protein NusG [Parachlamydiales bacterium]